MATIVRKTRPAGAARLLRKPLEARFVEILDLECNDRALTLIRERSRAVRRGDVHELMLTDESAAAPGGTAGGIDYVGFVEFQAGGMLVYGDGVVIGGRRIGTIAGFALGTTFAANIETIRQWIQGLTGTELFAAEIYFLSRLPAVIDPMEVVTVVAMGLSLSFLATLYPSWRAARTDPAEALRYE